MHTCLAGMSAVEPEKCSATRRLQAYYNLLITKGLFFDQEITISSPSGESPGLPAGALISSTDLSTAFVYKRFSSAQSAC